MPPTSSRILSVLPAGTKVLVNGSTLQGERNSVSYQGEDDNFFWADNSSLPESHLQSDDQEPDLAALQSSDSPAMGPAAATSRLSTAGLSLGIAEIDRVFTGASCAPFERAKDGARPYRLDII
jgi:hypothetical protein